MPAVLEERLEAKISLLWTSKNILIYLTGWPKLVGQANKQTNKQNNTGTLSSFNLSFQGFCTSDVCLKVAATANCYWHRIWGFKHCVYGVLPRNIKTKCILSISLILGQQLSFYNDHNLWIKIFSSLLTSNFLFFFFFFNISDVFK